MYYCCFPAQMNLISEASKNRWGLRPFNSQASFPITCPLLSFPGTLAFFQIFWCTMLPFPLRKTCSTKSHGWLLLKPCLLFLSWLCHIWSWQALMWPGSSHHSFKFIPLCVLCAGLSPPFWELHEGRKGLGFWPPICLEHLTVYLVVRIQ